MRKANHIFFKFLAVPILLSALYLIGCGSRDGKLKGDYDYVPNAYHNSSAANINNLASLDKVFSAYNGGNSIEIRNIPVNPKEVLYACMLTNPNYYPITNIDLVPPLVYKQSLRGSNTESFKTTKKNRFDHCSLKGIFRENPITKEKLKKELLKKYIANEASNKKKALRASVSHADEIENQENIIIPVLGKTRRHCTLAKVSNYAKFFVDQEQDYGVLPADISSEKMNEFAYEFDTYIYPLLKDTFGNGKDFFWDDVDKDSKLSIVFSPVCNNYNEGIAGIFDSSNMNHSQYPRDMICIAVQDSESSFEKWFMDSRETIAHEMQHIVNFSAKTNSCGEESWIDEGLAVCAEILYRKIRAEKGLETYSNYYNGQHQDFAGNDARLIFYAYYMPELSPTSFALNEEDLATTLAHYGQKGLFFYYLYEQYGNELLKNFCQGEAGANKFSEFIRDRSLEQLVIDFNFAVLYEKLRNINFSSLASNPYNFAGKKHKFIENMNLNFTLNNLNNDDETQKTYIQVDEEFILSKIISLDKKSLSNLINSENTPQGIPGNGGTARFFIKQPAGFSNIIHSNSYNLTISSSGPVAVNMIRMN